MAIDYSKWDKIELSDDSDIEVHPNVDKKSFIKWKQRDIHEKRMQRNLEIKSILVQLTMYTRLNERVDHVIDTVPVDKLPQQQAIIDALNSKFDPKEKFDFEKLKAEKGDSLRKGLRDLTFDAEEIENTPPYNEMVEDLFTQIKEDHADATNNGAKIVEYVKEHKQRIDDVLQKQTIKLDELLYQKLLLISSDDYHTGFDRSFLNKTKEEEPPKETAKTTTKETTIETINTPKANDVEEDLTVQPATAEFAKIKASDIEASAAFLVKHPEICTEQQKDALLMTGFEHQLHGDFATTKQVVHQSLILQYVAQLAGPHPSRDQTAQAVTLFCAKIKVPSPAREAFEQDVTNTVNHIKTRCEVIKKEQESNQEEEALIQLKALDDNTELFVNIPQEGTPEYEVFTTKLSPEMQTAVKTGSLEEVNKVFAKMKVEEAEAVLEVFNECSVIGVSGVLENEAEFEELQKQYHEGMELEDQEEDYEEKDDGKEEDFVNSADVVD